MKRFLACLALCASLSASAQDGCELFNFRELATENQQLSDSIAALNTELDNCGANLSGAYLGGAIMTCLRYGCPSSLPEGYICEPDTDCPQANRYRIVPE